MKSNAYPNPECFGARRRFYLGRTLSTRDAKMQIETRFERLPACRAEGRRDDRTGEVVIELRSYRCFSAIDETQIEIRTGEICENLWPVSRLVPRPVRRLR
jgi:hypothetical protein